MNDTIKKIMAEIKRIWFIPAAIGVGIVLMTIQINSDESVPVNGTVQNMDYAESMEQCVEEMLKSISGAEDSVVTINLADSGHREYVRENGEVLVVTDKQGNQSAVVARENAPEIAGVTVACSGAGSVSVRNSVIQSVSTLLGVGTNKVCVVLIGG